MPSLSIALPGDTEPSALASCILKQQVENPERIVNVYDSTMEMSVRQPDVVSPQLL